MYKQEFTPYNQALTSSGLNAPKGFQTTTPTMANNTQKPLFQSFVTTQQQQQQQQQQTQDPIQSYFQLMRPLSSDSPELKTLRDTSTQEAQTQQAGVDKQIQQVQGFRDQDTRLVQQQQQMAEKGLEDTMFNRFLQTQENMNRRGVLNSGLMADATTRLGMSRQDELARLYMNTQNNINQLNKQYSPQLSQLQTQRDMITPDSVYAKKEADFYNQRREQAKGLSDVFKYTNLTAKEQEESRQFNMEFNRKLDESAKRFQIDTAKLNIDYANTFGYDQNGNKTVDLQKLEEQIRSNLADENFRQADSFARRQSDAQALAQAEASAISPNIKQMISGYRNIVTDSQKEIDGYRAEINQKDSSDPQQLQQINELNKKIQQAEYNRAVAQIAALALATGDATDATTASQIGVKSATVTTAPPAKQTAAQAKAQATNASEASKFFDYQDEGTNLTSKNSVTSFEKAAKIAQQSGRKIKIPTSRYQEIKRYVEGRTTGSDTARGVFNLLTPPPFAGMATVGDKMANAKAIWSLMDKYPNAYDVVRDEDFNADYGE